MGTGRTYNKAPKTRPKKKQSERKRRVNTQKKRLIVLGLSEEKVHKLNSSEVRVLLKRPCKIVDSK